jgi:hypothetical protein
MLTISIDLDYEEDDNSEGSVNYYMTPISLVNLKHAGSLENLVPEQEISRSLKIYLFWVIWSSFMFTMLAPQGPRIYRIDRALILAKKKFEVRMSIVCFKYGCFPRLPVSPVWGRTLFFFF